MNIALRRKIIDFVREYDEKKAQISEALKAFEDAGVALKKAATICGTYGNTHIDTGNVHKTTLYESLNISAWEHSYNFLNIDYAASAKDKKKYQQAIANPPEFTFDNVAATFGCYVLNRRDNILRGLAEVFSDLDPAFKSHEKMKIGVKGLPKRVIVGGVHSYWGGGKEKLRDIINAIALYEEKPLVTHDEMDALFENEDALLKSRGIRLKRYRNDNGHLYFEPQTLKSVNKALAEYYGNVLADCCEEHRPNAPKQSTNVAKDLQYYPTPQEIVDRVLSDILIREGQNILEPSCGCGRFLDALREKNVHTLGVEVDLGRVRQCQKKGHRILQGNFLEIDPFQDFDHVIMNPPFYGKHYAKHVKHALKFLRKGGTLTAILPITARYDHGLVDGSWVDLPVGSFRESGTNINTCILTIRN